VASQAESEVDTKQRTQLRRLRIEIEESFPQIQEDDANTTTVELSEQCWEDPTGRVSASESSPS